MSLAIQVSGLAGSLINGFVAGAFSIPVAWTFCSVVVLVASLRFLHLIHPGEERDY